MSDADRRVHRTLRDIIQFSPLGIYTCDKLILLFPGDGSKYVRASLKVNKFIDIIYVREAFHEFRFVFKDSAFKVVSYAYV
jgi:hypothetical protein